MKLMLRPELRLWPLSSFLGLFDIKTGVTIALLFALLNKVAGVYGLIAVLTGAGGSFSQLSLYIYSVLGLVALAWGLRAVKEEDPKQTLYFAHLFAADHVLSTAWTVFFAITWWIWTPHDGRRQANSPAQEAMMQTANITIHLTQAEREAAAMEIWNQEKGTAVFVIAISWLIKIYLALLIYSYASHLRKGTYRSLPLSRANYTALPSSNSNNTYETALDMADDDEELGSLYRVPGSNSNSGRSHRRTASASSATISIPSGNANGNVKGHKHKTSSLSSFADFVSAPGRPRRSNNNNNNNNSNHNNFGSISTGLNGKAGNRELDIEEEVLFDEDEMTYVSSSSRAHSKMGTETSSTAASDEERERN